MKFQGAKVTEQNITFGIYLVKPEVISSASREEGAREFGRRVFGNVPIILASQNSRGRFKYSGRQDIVRFLANIHYSQIPWKEYTI